MTCSCGAWPGHPEARACTLPDCELRGRATDLNSPAAGNPAGRSCPGDLPPVAGALVGEQGSELIDCAANSDAAGPEGCAA